MRRLMNGECGGVNGLLLEGWKITGGRAEGRLSWEVRKWGGLKFDGDIESVQLLLMAMSKVCLRR